MISEEYQKRMEEWRKTPEYKALQEERERKKQKKRDKFYATDHSYGHTYPVFDDHWMNHADREYCERKQHEWHEEMKKETGYFQIKPEDFKPNIDNDTPEMPDPIPMISFTPEIKPTKAEIERGAFVNYAANLFTDTETGLPAEHSAQYSMFLSMCNMYYQKYMEDEHWIIGLNGWERLQLADEIRREEQRRYREYVEIDNALRLREFKKFKWNEELFIYKDHELTA